MLRRRARPRNDRPRFAKPVGDPRDAKGLYAAMRRFIEHRGVLGATDSGLYNLERYIRDFIGWAEHRAVTHPEHVTQAVLLRYQRSLYYYRKKDGMPLSIRSQRGKITPLRVFFKWLTRTGEIPANPAAEIDLPRNVHRLPRCVLTAEEAERVLALPDIADPLGLRDRAMMEMLYATGMRRMELGKIETGHIDFNRGLALIREGKGRKDRLIPLGERALYWVQTYLEQSRPLLAWNQQDATLFLSMEGYPLNIAWLSTTVAQYVEKAQLGKRGSCHMFRHTMATLMLEGGADIRFIQAMLGHADLKSTQIYTQVAIRQLQMVHERTHPGVVLRSRSALENADAPEPQPDPENAAEDLYAALDAEADDEARA